MVQTSLDSRPIKIRPGAHALQITQNNILVNILDNLQRVHTTPAIWVVNLSKLYRKLVRLLKNMFRNTLSL